MRSASGPARSSAGLSSASGCLPGTFPDVSLGAPDRDQPAGVQSDAGGGPTFLIVLPRPGGAARQGPVRPRVLDGAGHRGGQRRVHPDRTGELAAGVGRDHFDVLARFRRLDHLAVAEVDGDV